MPITISPCYLKCECVLVLSCFSRVWLFVTLWTVACQAPLSKGFSRQEYWSGLPFLSPGNLPNPGITPGSPALQEDFYRLNYEGSPFMEVVALNWDLENKLMEKNDKEYNQRWEYQGDWGGFGMHLKSLVLYSAGKGRPLSSICKIIPVSMWRDRWAWKECRPPVNI